MRLRPELNTTQTKSVTGFLQSNTKRNVPLPRYHICHGNPEDRKKEHFKDRNSSSEVLRTLVHYIRL